MIRMIRAIMSSTTQSQRARLIICSTLQRAHRAIILAPVTISQPSISTPRRCGNLFPSAEIPSSVMVILSLTVRTTTPEPSSSLETLWLHNNPHLRIFFHCISSGYSVKYVLYVLTSYDFDRVILQLKASTIECYYSSVCDTDTWSQRNRLQLAAILSQLW